MDNPFWVNEALIAATSIEQPRRGQVLGLVSELAEMAARQMRYLLQDETLPDDERFGDVVPALADLFRFQAELLRIDVDADDLDAFKAAWKRSVSWNEYWTPENDVDDLELQVRHGPVADKKQAERRLAAAQLAAAVKTKLDEAHRLALFQLGAWLADKRRKETLDRSRWDEILPYLIGAFSSSQAIVDAMAGLWVGAGERGLELLQNWQMERLTADGSVVGDADYLQVATRWATVLLLRSTSETQPPAIDLGHNAETLGRIILEHLAAIEQEEEKWGDAVSGDLRAKAEQIRAAIAAARAAAAEEAKRVLAEAELSPARVDEFAGAQRDAFAKHAVLRARLDEAGVLSTEEGSRTSNARSPVRIVSKRPFVEGAEHSIVIGWDDAGTEAARDEQEAIGAGLADVAERVDAPDPIVGAADAIEQMRAAGCPPDAVLVPARPWVRPMLAQDPDYRWAYRKPNERKELGYLREVPVFDVLARDADHMLVVNFGGALRVVEKREPGQASPLSVDVRLISPARATELVDSGRFGVAEDEAKRTTLIRALSEQNVEVTVAVEYEVTTQPETPDAAKRFVLGPATMGRPET